MEYAKKLGDYAMGLYSLAWATCPRRFVELIVYTIIRQNLVKGKLEPKHREIIREQMRIDDAGIDKLEGQFLSNLSIADGCNFYNAPHVQGMEPDMVVNGRQAGQHILPVLRYNLLPKDEFKASEDLGKILDQARADMLELWRKADNKVTIEDVDAFIFGYQVEQNTSFLYQVEKDGSQGGLFGNYDLIKK